MGEMDNRSQEEIYSEAVRAGKRTYFFDVKSTRSDELYLTITESKKRFNNEDGKFYFEKHKIFLYKEDFDKFRDGLSKSIEYIENQEEATADTSISGVSFEDLGDDGLEESTD